LINLLKYVILQGEIDEKNKIVNLIKKTFSEEIGNKMTTTAGFYHQEGIEQGIEQGKKEIAVNLLTAGVEINKIVELTKLPIEKIQELADAAKSSKH
jgi:predicted transposase/invertase (TIGR01784 family)